MRKQIICKECGERFTFRPHKPGLIDQCDDCGRMEERERGTRRTVGLQGGEFGGKSANIEIFREPNKGLAKLVRQMNSGGYHANNGLFIGSTTSTWRGNEEE